MSADPALTRLQQKFLGRLRGVPDGGLDALLGGGRMATDVGLRIYTHAYGARLREALDNDHPVLGVYLGDALWERLCLGYIAAHPSQVRSLRDFGAALPDYLARTEPFRAHPELAELAALERRLLDSFDAADAARAGWDALLALPPAQWPALRPRFHPSLRLHRVAWNSVELWRVLKDGDAPPQVAPAANRDWALWRDDARVTRFRSLDPQEHAALAHCLEDDGDFAGLCARLLAWHAQAAVPQVALGLLRGWCAEGWITRWA